MKRTEGSSSSVFQSLGPSNRPVFYLVDVLVNVFIPPDSILIRGLVIVQIAGTVCLHSQYGQSRDVF